jgi:hypothetical protein
MLAAHGAGSKPEVGKSRDAMAPGWACRARKKSDFRLERTYIGEQFKQMAGM